MSVKRAIAKPLRGGCRVLLRAVARLLFRIEVRGDFSRMKDGRLLIIANHESLIDGVLLGLFLPVDPVFVIYTGVVKNPFFRLVLSLADYLTVDPSSPMGMKTVIRLVESGRPVVIFPEGRITLTGSLMKVYDGPAFVAAKTGATIVPVRLDGAARSYFSRLDSRHPRRLLPKITLSVLPPTSITVTSEGSAHAKRRKAGEAMRRLMQEMIFVTQPMTTLFATLVDAMDIFGRRRPTVEDTKQVEYTYGEVVRMTLMLGRIAARQAAPGERIALLLPSLVPTLALIVGISAFRRVPALLNYTAGTQGMQSACVAAEVRTLITSRAFLEQAKLVEKVAALENVNIVYLEDLRNQMGLGDKLWWLCFARWFPRAAPPSGAQTEDAAAVLFTSGSEGRPKGVVLSHRAILSNIAQIRAVIDFSGNDKVLNALPLFHSFGLTAGSLLPLLTGARLFLYPTPLHYRIIPEIAYDRSCTVLFGTSTFLGNYAKHAHPYDFYHLRYVVAGAEKLSQAVRESWFEKFGIRILEGYGATETAPVLAVNTPMAFRSGTVGQFLPGIAHKILPISGIPTGGMLHVKGPNLMSGYYRFEAPGVLEVPHSEAGSGWYETGDVVDVDADGFVRIIGRVKRFAKIAGEMIALESVEKIAIAASSDASHAATTCSDAERGEKLVLFTTDPALARDRLQRAARELGLPELAVPRLIFAVDALPILGTGKTDYVTLKQMAETRATQVTAASDSDLDSDGETGEEE